MRVVVVGAGSVGRSIARELLHNEHEVLIIDKVADTALSARVPDASWLVADACEIDSLAEARLDTCDSVVCATGDDKVNLVVSLLAKTEFGVPRTVARVNNPKNEWMFNETWGVDVAVSTPRLMTALVEEAVAVGDLVRIFEFEKGRVNMVELTLPTDSPFAGTRIGDIPFPEDCTLIGLIRDGRPYPADPNGAIEVDDELLLLATPETEEALARLLNPATKVKPRHELDED